MAFSGISREVLDIAGRLRDELGRPDLAQHLARLQEREQEKLQLVSAGLEGSQEQCWDWFGGSQLPWCPPTDGTAAAGPAAGTGAARGGCPSAGGAGAQTQVSGGFAVVPPYFGKAASPHPLPPPILGYPGAS